MRNQNATTTVTPPNPQVRSNILAEAVHCPAEKAVLLASFAVQAKYGNQDPEVLRLPLTISAPAPAPAPAPDLIQVHEDGYLAADNLLPASVVTEHKLTRSGQPPTACWLLNPGS